MSDKLPKGWASARLSEVAEINPRHPRGLAAACSGRLTADWREMNPTIESALDLLQKISELRAGINASRGDKVRTRKTAPASIEILQPGNFLDVPETWTWLRFGSIIGELRNGVPLRPDIEPQEFPCCESVPKQTNVSALGKLFQKCMLEQ